MVKKQDLTFALFLYLWDLIEHLYQDKYNIAQWSTA